MRLNRFFANCTGTLTIEADYNWYGKIEHELRQQGIIIQDTAFTDKVTIVCLPEAGEAERLAADLTNVTQGKCPIKIGEGMYMTHPIDE